MKRALLLAAAGVAAIAVVLPATAGAASFKGVVIAKKSARHAVVTASKGGVVRTTRVHGSLGRFRIGRHVFVQGAVLPDGTYAASKIRLLKASAKGVRFHGSVVWATAKQLVVSAGSSVFSLALRGGTSAPSASGGLQPGDDLNLSADVKGGALQTSPNRLHKTGHSDELVLEGIYLDTADDGTIELAVVHRGRVYVQVPDDVFVPAFNAGDVIALVVTVEEDGTFTLVKADDESGDGDGDGGHVGKTQFTVAGVIASMDDHTVSVTAGDGDTKTVTCAVMQGFDLSGYEVGQLVLMTCKYDGGKPILISLQKKGSESEYLVALGKITDLEVDSITVQGDGAPVTCSVPDDMDLSDYEVDDSVVIKCVKEDGVWTLRGIENRDPAPPPPPSYLKVTGPITALDDANITVHGETGLATCFVPDGADLSDFAVNDTVQMICLHTDDGWRLKRLQSDSALWEDS